MMQRENGMKTMKTAIVAVALCVVCGARGEVGFAARSIPRQTGTATSTEATRHAGNPVYPTYDGRVMAGYQGWLHVRPGGVMYPDEESVRIDKIGRAHV